MPHGVVLRHVMARRHHGRRNLRAIYGSTDMASSNRDARAQGSGKLLEGVRVLDLTNRRGELAGRLLADLGAEVWKVEPPGGVDSRHLPPFGPDGTSLFWTAYGAGKRCVQLDLTSEADRSVLRGWVTGADVVLESANPGELEALGIGEAALREANPGLIYVAITPYGQHGPKASWPATDLTLEAAGGRLSIQGDPDRAPLPVGFPQAFLHAGAQAAADTIVALNERGHSGLGQFLDLSAQEAMWWTLMAAQGTPICIGEDPPGAGDDRGPRAVGQGPRTVHAKDGLVTIAAGASPPGTRTMFTWALAEARERGEAYDAALDDVDWDDWIPAYRGGELGQAQLDAINALLDDFIGRRTKLELIDWALEGNLRLGPLNTTRDLLEFPQFRERGVFDSLAGAVQPAKWVHPSRTPVGPGETLATGGAPAWTPREPAQVTGAARSGLAFEGLKVADFSWVAAGPTVAKALADHGATVVKVESSTRADLSRTLAPHIDGEPGLNRSYWSFLYATSKLSLQCHLGTPEGRQLARQVCDWADVVVESFSPGTMERMGLDYATLSADRDDLIMFSTSMLGQTGPLSAYAGFGQQASGFCGLHAITGWPDRDPCGVATPYTDVIAPKFGIASLGAAILERARSGLGQHIDLAQAECSMLFLAPLILDESVNGRTALPTGFESPYAAPQGVLACTGTERYVTVSVETDSQWRALCSVVAGLGDGSEQEQVRRDDGARILEVLATWCGARDAFEVERALTAAGVPASAVQRPTDATRDPQFEARGFAQTLPHGECGDVQHWGFCTRFSAKQEMVRTAPPCIGEHNDTVLREMLRLSDSEIEALYRAGAIE